MLSGEVPIWMVDKGEKMQVFFDDKCIQSFIVTHPNTILFGYLYCSDLAYNDFTNDLRTAECQKNDV